MNFEENPLVEVIKTSSMASSFQWRNLRLVNKHFSQSSATKEELIRARIRLEYQKIKWDHAVARSIRTGWEDHVEVKESVTEEHGRKLYYHNFSGKMSCDGNPSAHRKEWSNSPLSQGRAMFRHGLGANQIFLFDEFTLTSEEMSAVVIRGKDASSKSFNITARYQSGVTSITFINDGVRHHTSTDVYKHIVPSDIPFPSFMSSFLGDRTERFREKFSFDTFRQFIKILRPVYPSGVHKHPFRPSYSPKCRRKYGKQIPRIMISPENGDIINKLDFYHDAIHLVQDQRSVGIWIVNDIVGGGESLIPPGDPDEKILLGKRC